MNSPDGPKRLLHPIFEARQLLGDTSNSKFYDLVQEGEICIVKIGRRSFVTDAELNRYVALLEKQMVEPPKPEGSEPEGAEAPDARSHFAKIAEHLEANELSRAGGMLSSLGLTWSEVIRDPAVGDAS